MLEKYFTERFKETVRQWRRTQTITNNSKSVQQDVFNKCDLHHLHLLAIPASFATDTGPLDKSSPV